MWPVFPQSMSDFKPGEEIFGFPRARFARCGRKPDVFCNHPAYARLRFQREPATRFFNALGGNTRTCGRFFDTPPAKFFKEAIHVAVKEKIRIRIKGYDHQLVDQSAEKIVATAKRTGAQVSGPVPLPTEKQIITILRAVHKYKDSREQFEMRTHKRLIDILRPSNKTVEALMGLELPAGVEIEIKL